MTVYNSSITSGTQRLTNMSTMGKVDTSDLVMMIRFLNISPRSPYLEWASLTHSTPRNANKIANVTATTKYILNIRSTEYTPEAFTTASRLFHRLCCGVAFRKMLLKYGLPMLQLLHFGQSSRYSPAPWVGHNAFVILCINILPIFLLTENNHFPRNASLRIYWYH